MLTDFKEYLRNNTKQLFYVFAGKSSAWANEASPTAANVSLQALQNDVYHNLLFGKRLTDSDVAYALPRVTYNVSAQTVYSNYDITANNNLGSYTITSNNHVFKCIDNANGAPSTVEPSFPSTIPFKTSDGYTWRYLYTIGTNDSNKFSTATFVPITTNNSIANSAVPGPVEFISVSNGGSSYSAYHTSNIVSVINSTAIVIANTASNTTNIYKDSSIYIRGNYGTSQVVKIASYDGAAKIVSLTSPLALRLQLDINANTYSGIIAAGNRLTQETLVGTIATHIGEPSAGDTIVFYDNDGNYSNATIVDASTTTIRMNRVPEANGAAFDSDYAWRIGAGVAQSGTVSVANATTLNVTGTSTTFTTAVSVGNYIRISNRVRRVASITNNTLLATDIAFGNAFTSNAWIKETSAGYFSNVEVQTANATVEAADINSYLITLGSITGSFTTGEQVMQTNNTSVTAYGTVTYANTTKLYVSNTQGSFVSTVNVVGSSSNATATIATNGNGYVYIESTPRIIANSATGNWYSGKAFTYDGNVAVGNVTVVTFKNFPDQTFAYSISPTVVITGDGSGAAAYSVINTSSNSVYSVVVTNSGSNYTFANATILANTLYGSNASLSVRLGPLSGSGVDVARELGTNAYIITATFGNGYNEGYAFPINGSYRTVGIISDPSFANLSFTISSFLRKRLTLTNLSGSFTLNEIVYQPNTAAAGIVVSSNTTTVDIDRISGTFISSTANDNIKGMISSVTANVTAVTNVVFSVSNTSQVIAQDVTDATATPTAANTTVLTVTNVHGLFLSSNSTLTANDIAAGARAAVYDSTTNTYALISSIGSSRRPTNFTPNSFTQLARITLTGVVGTFTNNEMVTQASQTGNGYVYNTLDRDLQISSVSGTFVIGDKIIQNTSSANAVVISSNSTHLKLTDVNGTFQVGNTIATVGGSGASANVANIFNVLQLYNVSGNFVVGSDVITGATSNATGTPSLANTVFMPELVRDSGEVLYIQNSTAITRTANNQEQIKFIIEV
jgi:hypothetical protein